MDTVKFFMRNKSALAAVLLGVSVVTTSVPAFADTTITIAGSTALLPLVKDAANAYQQAHPDVKISVSGGGSGSGIAQVAGKAVQIGDSDITASAHPELHDNRVAVVGFAVIVHPGVTVKNLSKKQLQDIFSGKIANWKELGGADQKMVVINRPRSSGTRAVFTKTIMVGVPINESSLTEDATGTVVSVVKQTPGAISYAAFSGTRGAGLTELAVDGVEPTDDNIIHGKYPIWSYEHMFTLGPPTGEVSRFIAFVQSNSTLVKKDGFILIRDMRVTETDR
ncbi:MAG: phosphate transport system substrate-binding protein [Candidatus Eremiobacteraeota bacterium]|jgi:phosphate transport system substrate-binding protein|nr:phosphate transport system substrate-binding protein [Candidatus Eremiobacteraeota bacterium]